MLRRVRGAPAEPLHVRAPQALLELRRDGRAPLAAAVPERSAFSVAVIVPSFRRGSGGHSTLAHLLRGLEALGHECSVWVEDDEGRHAGLPDAELDAQFKAFFGPLRAPVHGSFAGWTGADIVVATGWQTVPRVLRLPGAKARAYLVQDHEPEFYGTSAEATWAAETYGLGLHCVCASPWLAELVRTRYGATVSHFDLGVDHATYRPHPGVPRRDDVVMLYARAVTPRRAVPLGLLALEELHRRRPGLELVLFGEARPITTRFPHRHAGVMDGDRLARAYAEATVGVVLSMTNPSLVPTEMLACGLPCVDLASPAMVSTFGDRDAVELAPFDPIALAEAIERVLDDPALRARRANTGLELVAGRTWAAAAEQVQDGLRTALAPAGRRTL